MATTTTKRRTKKYPKLPAGTATASDIIRDLKITPAELRRARAILEETRRSRSKARSAAK